MLRQREAERNIAELGDGVSTSLSGPELEVGDGGGRDEEIEGWKIKEDIKIIYKVDHICCHCHMCICLFFGFVYVYL